MNNNQRKFRSKLRPGRNGSYCYEILSPSGEVIVNGARIGTKAEVQAHVDKFVQRANNGGWQPSGVLA